MSVIDSVLLSMHFSLHKSICNIFCLHALQYAPSPEYRRLQERRRQTRIERGRSGCPAACSMPV